MQVKNHTRHLTILILYLACWPFISENVVKALGFLNSPQFNKITTLRFSAKCCISSGPAIFWRHAYISRVISLPISKPFLKKIIAWLSPISLVYNEKNIDSRKTSWRSAEDRPIKPSITQLSYRLEIKVSPLLCGKPYQAVNPHHNLKPGLTKGIYSYLKQLSTCLVAQKAKF